ncbi:hypothetical protein [Desulfovibrio oxyclinae]|jgi:hypothetical protein|uniref:hypothetical protein n=1 Tax=Desulfovibrio oxyclinae TaxID=63560 RepID=UPI0003828140|nr:hypothetical protein [Desulfovibrio oxyclinae]
MQKNLLQSKTVISSLAGMGVLLFSLFGLDVQAGELEKILTLLAAVATTVGTIYGRIKARDKVVAGKPDKTGLGVVLLIVTLGPALSGCALKNLPPHEQAVAVTDEITTAFESVDTQYRQLLPQVEPDTRKQLKTDVAPLLNRTKTVLVLLRNATDTWRYSRTRPGDWPALLDKARSLLTQAKAAMNRILGG